MSFVSECKYSVSLGSQITLMSWCRSWASWTIWIHSQLPVLKDNAVLQNPCLIFICGYVSHVCFKVTGKQLGMEGINFSEIWSECWEVASVTCSEVFFTWAVGKKSLCLLWPWGFHWFQPWSVRCNLEMEIKIWTVTEGDHKYIELSRTLQPSVFLLT